MDLGDRFEEVFVGFGRLCWIRVKVATYLDVSGKIWLDLVGFGRRYMWIYKLYFVGQSTI